MITIIGKMDLPPNNKLEKSEVLRNQQEILDAVNQGMEISIPLINERLKNYENAPESLIGNDGSITMESYENVYGKEVVENERAHSRLQQHAFYQTYDLRNQERYGTGDRELLLEKMIKEERMRDGNISEEALFLLMNKIAGNQFIAMRSSIYDDYVNGTDLLLIDTVSGKTICAFDETVEGKNSRLEGKIISAKKKIQNQEGFKVKYGVSFNQESSMKLGKVENIPPHYF